MCAYDDVSSVSGLHHVPKTLRKPSRENQPSRWATLTFGSQSAYWVVILATEPSPSKSIQVTHCRIIPQPLRHAALVGLILLSGFTLPGASVCNKTSNLQ